MRQPVCVGCDGKELLTLNSVTAPLTEPHLNGHKTSPKDLRNTSSFWRGTRGGGQPRKAAKERSPRRGENKPSPKTWTMSGVQRGSPAGAVAAPPCHKCSIRRDPEPRAMGSGAPNSTGTFVQKDGFGVYNQQTHCRPGNGSMVSTSACSAGDVVVVGCHGPLPGSCCLLTIWGIASRPKKLSKQGHATKTSGWKQPAWKVPRATNHSLKLFWYAPDQAMHPLFAWETAQNTEKTGRQWHKHTVNTILLLSWEQTNRICRA